MSDITVIVGGSGGIGSETARRLIARGTRVALVARDGEALQRVAAELEAPAFPCDVLVSDAFAALVERIEGELGEIDGLVHAVGSIVLRPLHLLSVEDWRATIEVNATSAFLALKATLPKMMRRRRGSVALFSSVATRTALANHEAIAAAKGAVEGLVRSAAIGYARYGIRVNAVAPALTKTPLSRSLWSSEASLSASAAMHPLGRIGEARDIAAAVTYLLSEEASWVTGQIIGVDGGLGTGLALQRLVAK